MRTLAAEADHIDEIKKSRFHAKAAPVASPEEALAFLARIREPDATHNCWAYRIGDTYRFSDDGEPGGTAGKPILGAIDRLELDLVVVVVTRFFGGIKLGAGGLARAYGSTAAACLRAADLIERLPRVRAVLRVGFEFMGPIHTLLNRFSVEKLAESFDEDGLHLRVRLAQRDLDAFRQAVADATRGGGSIQVADEGPAS